MKGVGGGDGGYPLIGFQGVHVDTFRNIPQDKHRLQIVLPVDA